MSQRLRHYLVRQYSAIVDFNITNANAGIYTWDFGDGETTTSAGNISHGYTIPVYYTATVTGCMTDCLPLNSCTAQLIEFKVIDTVFESAGPAFSDQQFIKIYPNPVEKYLHVVITGPYTFQYEIMTVAGQKTARRIRWRRRIYHTNRKSSLRIIPYQAL